MQWLNYLSSKMALRLFMALLLVYAYFFYPRWERSATENTLGWDVSGYYLYLPSVFIYKDIKQVQFYRDSVLKNYGFTPELDQCYQYKNGNWIMRYPIGQALLMLPSFTIAHIYAKNSGTYKADGFSYPYQKGIGLGLLLYSCIGLWYLRKILVHFFSDKIAMLTIFFMVVGTNYLEYGFINQALTHGNLFMLYTLIIYHTIQWHEKHLFKNAVFIGVFCGLAAIVRPIDLVSIAIPIFWQVHSKATFLARLRELQLYKSHFIAAAIVVVLIGSIQLLYWKSVGGDWLIYSYQGFGFDWLHPHCKDYAFSARSGWLLYAPLLMLAIMGLFFVRKENGLFLLLFAAGYFYIVSAWSVWWYGGRAMVQIYPLLAFGLASLLQFVYTKNRNWILKISCAGLLLLFTYLNIWWCYHAHYGNIPVAETSKYYYWATVGRWSADEETKKLLDTRMVHRGPLKDAKVLYQNNFDTPKGDSCWQNGYLMLDSAHQSSNSYYFTVPKDKKFLRASAVFTADTIMENNVWSFTQFVVTMYREKKIVRTNQIRVQRFLQPNISRSLYVDVECKPRIPFDEVAVHFWNAGSRKVVKIDSLEVVGYR